MVAVVNRFIKGRTYKFSEEVFRKDCGHTMEWAIDADGELVEVAHEFFGMTKSGYGIHPDWCVEVKPVGATYKFSLKNFMYSNAASDVPKWAVKSDGVRVIGDFSSGSIEKLTNGYMVLKKWCVGA